MKTTIGLIRQYFPKGTEFEQASTREIKRVQRELNDRSRTVFRWENLLRSNASPVHSAA